jgi:hypothetical protein
MQIINVIFNKLGDLVLWPVSGAHAWLLVLWSSFVIALVAMLIFKGCTQQQALRSARDRVLARILEFRLFKDDVWAVFGIFGRVVRATAVYFCRTVPAFLILLVPLVLLIIQVGVRMEWRPLKVGEKALVYARMPAGQPMLEAAPSLIVETEPFQSQDMYYWRIRVQEKDPQAWVQFRSGNGAVRQPVAVGGGMPAITPERSSGSFWKTLEYPREPPIPASAGIAVTGVEYPRRHLRIGLHDINWLLAIFICSMLFGLVLKYPLRVEL